MARTMAQVLSGQAPAIARPRVKRAAAKAKPAHTGKRHAPAKKRKSKKATDVQCWTRTNATGGTYKNCAKVKTKPKARGKAKPLIARTNQLVPGITAPMYGTMTVRQGAAAQRGIQLRRPGGGAQPRSFVQLPPRTRRMPARYQ